ncbi:MAG: VWA domain-containing protein [Nautiliaceae bacterium]
MELLKPYYLFGIIFLVFLFFIKPTLIYPKKIVIKGEISKKVKFYLFGLVYLLIILALSRPVIKNKETVIKIPQNIVIALDISKDMQKKEFYPNNESFAVQKIEKLLKLLKHQQVALMAFSNKAYLISPPTTDYNSLIYLLNHLKTSINSDSNIQNAIQKAKKIAQNPKIVIFSTKPTNKAYVYLLNKAPQSQNIFVASYDDESLKDLAKALNDTKNQTVKIKSYKELFYYPLILTVIILFLTLFYPFKRRKV